MYVRKDRLSVFAACSALIAVCFIGGTGAGRDSAVVGPERFYQDLGCVPQFRNSDPFPYQYHCRSIEKRRPNKCYLHGAVYNVGDTVRATFRGVAKTCKCKRTSRYVKAAFHCPPTGCAYRAPRIGYYRQRNVTEFCPGPEIYSPRPQDRYQCRVRGLLYSDGSYFRPKKPDTECYCRPGYKGLTRRPYCLRVSENPCKTELYYSADVAHGCAPVFEMHQAADLECPEFFACPHPNDRMLTLRFSQMQYGDVDCRFGDVRMKFGQEMVLHNQARYDGCVICYCSVGPMPTCIRFPWQLCHFLLGKMQAK